MKSDYAWCRVKSNPKQISFCYRDQVEENTIHYTSACFLFMPLDKSGYVEYLAIEEPKHD